MHAGEILLARDGDIATVTLNNPERLNALDSASWKRLGRGHARARPRRVAALRACCAARATRPSPPAPTSPSSRRRAATRRSRANTASRSRRRWTRSPLPASGRRHDPRRLRRRRPGDRLPVRPAHLRRPRAASACRSTSSGWSSATARCRALVGLVGRAAALEILLEGRDAQRSRSEGHGPREPRGAPTTRSRRKRRAVPRGASPPAHRWSHAGTRSSLDASPPRAPFRGRRRNEAYTCCTIPRLPRRRRGVHSPSAKPVFKGK